MIDAKNGTVMDRIDVSDLCHFGLIHNIVSNTILNGIVYKSDRKTFFIL